ncbi:MAG: hypothetical protein JWM09_1504 [Francisellaceae bacterium]|nr:hypothetical protein [Francisellaceae bacterium]
MKFIYKFFDMENKIEIYIRKLLLEIENLKKDFKTNRLKFILLNNKLENAKLCKEALKRLKIEKGSEDALLSGTNIFIKAINSKLPFAPLLMVYCYLDYPDFFSSKENHSEMILKYLKKGDEFDDSCTQVFLALSYLRATHSDADPDKSFFYFKKLNGKTELSNEEKDKYISVLESLILNDNNCTASEENDFLYILTRLASYDKKIINEFSMFHIINVIHLRPGIIESLLEGIKKLPSSEKFFKANLLSAMSKTSPSTEINKVLSELNNLSNSIDKGDKPEVKVSKKKHQKNKIKPFPINPKKSFASIKSAGIQDFSPSLEIYDFQTNKKKNKSQVNESNWKQKPLLKLYNSCAKNITPETIPKSAPKTIEIYKKEDNFPILPLLQNFSLTNLKALLPTNETLNQKSKKIEICQPEFFIKQFIGLIDIENKKIIDSYNEYKDKSEFNTARIFQYISSVKTISGYTDKLTAYMDNVPIIDLDCMESYHLHLNNIYKNITEQILQIQKDALVIIAINQDTGKFEQTSFTIKNWLLNEFDITIKLLNKNILPNNKHKL